MSMGDGMRIAVASGLAGTASLIAGIVVPMMVPRIEPWVGYSLLAVASGMFLVALVLWLSERARSPAAAPSITASGDRAVAVGGDNNAPIHTGDTHFHGKQPFLLTQNDLNLILAQIDRTKPVELTTATDFEMGDRLHRFLLENGVNVTSRQNVGLLINIPPYHKPVHIEANDARTIIVLDPS